MITKDLIDTCDNKIHKIIICCNGTNYIFYRSSEISPLFKYSNVRKWYLSDQILHIDINMLLIGELFFLKERRENPYVYQKKNI